MHTWAVWIFGLMVFNMVLKAIVLGYGNYPRTTKKQDDAIDLILNLCLIIWGATAIW